MRIYCHLALAGGGDILCRHAHSLLNLVLVLNKLAAKWLTTFVHEHTQISTVPQPSQFFISCSTPERHYLFSVTSGNLCLLQRFSFCFRDQLLSTTDNGNVRLGILAGFIQAGRHSCRSASNVAAPCLSVTNCLSHILLTCN